MLLSCWASIKVYNFYINIKYVAFLSGNLSVGSLYQRRPDGTRVVRERVDASI